MEDNNGQELGLGQLLRSVREKKGLSQDQLARIIRLRKHFIEALENEEWEKLPSPVFVKGFIRSYAQAIGLDGKETVGMYNRLSVGREESPRPLVEPQKSRTKYLYLLIPLLAAIVFLIYLFTGNEDNVPEVKEDVAAKVEEINPVGEENKEAQIAEEKSEPEEINRVKESEEVKDQVSDSDIIETTINAVPLVENTQVGQEQEFTQPPIDETVADIQAGTDNEPVPNYVLTGIVNSETYVKIYVDDNLPKEYIFQPGSRPQWTANKGFDVLIGNAGGIEFEFNGERVKDIGKSGKVVRVRFPKDFESSIYEE